jgi:hypothetical protein
MGVIGVEGIRIEWLLAGTVNGKAFTMNGSGLGDCTTGHVELHLTADPEFPAGFDPVSCPCICSHPTSSYFARADGRATFLSSGPDDFDVPDREGWICDQSGTELLRLKVSSHVYVTSGLFRIENTMQGYSHLPALRRNVTPVRDYILPAEDGALAVVRFQLLTQTGETLFGTTVASYRWKGEPLAQPLMRTLNRLDVKWSGKEVSAYYQAQITALQDDLVQTTSVA